jgi:hypothetical protein
MPTRISSSRFQLDTVKLWKPTRRTIYRSTWMYPGLSMVTYYSYYFGRVRPWVSHWGLIMASCMLYKVASGNDHYSTSCIASHCAVVSVGTVKVWDPLPQCSSATDAYHMHGIFSPGFPGLLESIYVTHHAFCEFHSIPGLSSHHRSRYLGRRRSEQHGEVGDERVLWNVFLLEGPDLFIIVAVSIILVHRGMPGTGYTLIHNYRTAIPWLLYGITAESDYFTWGRSSSPQSMTNPHQASSVGNKS